MLRFACGLPRAINQGIRNTRMYLMVAQFHPAHDAMLDFLVEKATPQEILAYEISEDERERALELLNKQEEGTLTPQEEAELDAIEQMELLYMALRAKALKALHKSA
jgi:hypothetical protein